MSNMQQVATAGEAVVPKVPPRPEMLVVFVYRPNSDLYHKWDCQCYDKDDESLAHAYARSQRRAGCSVSVELVPAGAAVKGGGDA